MATEPVVPPEAALIKERRKDRLPPMGVPAAAAAATSAGVKMSPEGWRSIETGRHNGPPGKLAIMAQVVGITPDELAEIGRRFGRENAAEAARLLEAHLRRRVASEPALAAIDTDSVPEQVLQLILEGIDDIRTAKGLTDAQKSSLEQSLIHVTMQSVSAQIVQIRTTLKILGEKARQG
ncbi:hypothetical protein ABZ912_19735 [Nonomuraea angiospora]|uniref:hypothetical protein n=1 Tax=Nonomuraea angiospora TaxID=46172 RepID=UPI00341157D1